MSEFIPITAVVLAAGTSSRMGNFKPLLPIQGIPMIETVLYNVLSFPFFEVKTVVGFRENEIRDQVKINDSRFSWVINKHYRDGLSTSIKVAGDSYNKESHGMLVFLGDQPLLQKSTIQEMLNTIIKEKLDQATCIAQPTYQGITGHPVYLSPQMIPYLETLSGDKGAKAVFHLAEKQIHIPVEDSGTIIDLDTKKDYFTHIVQNEQGDGSGGIFS